MTAMEHQQSAPQTPDKAQQRRSLTPQQETPGSGLTVVNHSNKYITSDDSYGVRSQAAALSDARIHVIQRQLLAAEIGRTRGNGYLQQEMAIVRQARSIARLEPHHMSDQPGESGVLQGDSDLASRETAPTELSKNEVLPGSDLILQRDSGGTPREFIPQISCDPDITFMRVYQHHRQGFRIDNRRDAPPGTSFHWGYGIDGNGVVSLLGDRTANEGGTKQVEVEGQRPGDTNIQATPVYQVPGGPEMTGDVKYAAVSVFEPTLELFGIMYRRADGTGITTDRVGVGDKIIVRVKVGNVDGAHLPDVLPYSLSGEGVIDSVSTGSITPVQQFTDGKSFDVELTARMPGSVNAELELGIGQMAIGSGAKVTGIHAEIEYNRQEFINLANQCDTKINIAYTRANSIMEVLSAAYGNAYDAHVRILEAQDASNRLIGDLILNAALAFIPGGVGGVVGGMMKDAKHGNFMIDAVKDMAKAGTRGLQGVLAGAGGRGGDNPMQPMADDPRSWRAQYAVRVNSEKEYVLGILDEWKTKANNSDPDFYLNFNPVRFTEQSLTRDGQALIQIQVPDQAEHERLYELGFWKTWLTEFGYTVVTTPGGYLGPQSHATENQGKKIRDRINALGQNGDQWLEAYGGIARQRAEAEAERRNRNRYGL